LTIISRTREIIDGRIFHGCHGWVSKTSTLLIDFLFHLGLLNQCHSSIPSLFYCIVYLES
jgi:hypothetical protein